MQKFIIRRNYFLGSNIQAYYHSDYTNMGAPGNPDYINVVKNDFGNSRTDYRNVHMALEDGCNIMRENLLEDLSEILKDLGTSEVTLCAIPRSKCDYRYKSNQLRFREIVSQVAKRLGLEDGSNYIVRTKNTLTTHRRYSGDINNDGEQPYKGITKDTCSLSYKIKGKDIILIEDIYTETVNIDEDCIQALLDAGANSVTFYAFGRTVRKNWY